MILLDFKKYYAHHQSDKCQQDHLEEAHICCGAQTPQEATWNPPELRFLDSLYEAVYLLML